MHAKQVLISARITGLDTEDGRGRLDNFQQTVNCKGFGRKCPWPKPDSTRVFASRDQRDRRKASVSIVDAPSEIPTGDLLKKNLERYTYASLLSV
jgi:hypothetical protein